MSKEILTNKKRELTMRFAGGLIKHLGLQMYSGAVPAIAELIANAWDGMARNVNVTIPFGRPLDSSHKIIVRDDGHGMSFGECDNEYLVVGRDRRRVEGDYSKSYRKIRKRRLMSRKGIGKLSGFGIANRIEVRTVKNGQITHFALDYDGMTRSGKFIDEYHPSLLDDDGKKTKESPGTTVILTQIKLTRKINEEHFQLSMARRFTILSDPEFKLCINGKPLRKEKGGFQFRYPPGKNTWKSENVKGVGDIKWWIGFTKQPIPDEEARGITVFTRGKMSQAPWFFGLSGGTWGQHGMQYMTGEVIVDQLDQTDGVDYIATDRMSILWEEPVPAALKEWGTQKIKDLLSEWVKERTQAKITRPEVKKYIAYAQKLPERERRIFNSFVTKICSIPQIDKDREILDELIEFGYNALTSHHFMDIIRQLNATKPEDWQNLQKALEEWTIIEAVETARVVKGHLEIIEKFQQLIDAKVCEKPDMQDFLCKYPWLLDPTWTMVEHEKRLDTILKKHFFKQKKSSKSKEGRKRLDFFCLADSSRVLVVEVKRPGENIGKKELRQVVDYVDYLKKNESGTSDPERPKRMVQGYLIAGGIQNDALPERKRAQGGGVFMRTWDALLKTAKEAHKQYFDIVKKRAPKGDPRIINLEEPDEKRMSGR